MRIICAAFARRVEVTLPPEAKITAIDLLPQVIVPAFPSEFTVDLVVGVQLGAADRNQQQLEVTASFFAPNRTTMLWTAKNVVVIAPGGRSGPHRPTTIWFTPTATVPAPMAGEYTFRVHDGVHQMNTYFRVGSSVDP